MIIPTEDDDIKCSRDDRSIIAVILTSLAVGDTAIHPMVVDLGGILKNPDVKFREKKVGKVIHLSRTADNLGITALIKFDDTPISLQIYRMYHSGILSSFVLDVEVKTRRSISGDDRFPKQCKTFVDSASLRSIDVDPYAPIS